MAAKLRGTWAVALLVVVSAAGVAIAADLNNALINADGRRKAAENGLRQIKAKSRDQAEQVHPLYAEAASRNNAWLDIVCQAIKQGASTTHRCLRGDRSRGVRPCGVGVSEESGSWYRRAHGAACGWCQETNH